MIDDGGREKWVFERPRGELSGLAFEWCRRVLCGCIRSVACGLRPDDCVLRWRAVLTLRGWGEADS